MLQNERGKSPAETEIRSRALSDSLRSSRAEKRMGRLFKPPNGQGTQGSQTDSEQHHAGDTMGERTFSNIAPQSRMVMGNQDRTVSDQGHSLGIDRPAVEKGNSVQQQTSLPVQKQQQQQQQQTTQQIEQPQPKYKTRERLNTLSTLTETVPPPVQKGLPLNELLILSKKFKIFYDQFIKATSVLNTNVEIKFKSHNVFLTVLETTERNMSKFNIVEDVSVNASNHLALSIVQCMADLRMFIQNLKLSLIPLNKPKSSDLLKTVYFSIFSLFTEIVNIAKLVIPITKPLKKQTGKTGKRQRKPKLEGQSQSQVGQSQNQIQRKSQIQSRELKQQQVPHPLAQQQQIPFQRQQQQRQHSQTLQTKSSHPQQPSSASSHLSFKTQPMSKSRSSFSHSNMQRQSQAPAPLPTQKPPHNQQYPQSKLKPSLSISRVPAPNPTTPSAQSLTMRKTPSRSFSSAMRQDSDLSMFNIPQDQLIGDERLVESISHTIQSAQVVFSQVSSAISKSAISTAQAQNAEASDPTSEPLNTIATKVKELTGHCMNSMEKTRRLKIVLHSFKNRPTNIKLDELQQTLYETTNMFLKSIIAILAATKGAIEDLPALNEVRSSLSILTRATKELTIKLETSSLKNSVVSINPLNVIDQPSLSSIPSMSTFHGNGPLSAVIPSSSIQFDLGNYPMSAGVVNNFPGGGISRRQSTRVVSTGSLQQQQQQQQQNLGSRLQRHDVLETKGSIDSMQQHIKTLQQQSNSIKNSVINGGGNDLPIQTPISVTTPLIASIGTTAASAVLPISSPLKSLNEQQQQSSQSAPHGLSSSVISKSTSNSNINSVLKSSIPHKQKTPKQMEMNPFDKILF